jgi:hypothetical protein
MSVASSSAPAANRSPAQRRRRWSIVLACLLALAAVPIAGYLYLAISADRELEMAIAEVDRVDPRWRFDDWLADRKPIPDAENPALVCMRVDALLQRNGVNGYDVGEKNRPLFESMRSVDRLNDPQVAALRETLQKHAEALKLGRTLKHYPGEGRFSIKYTADFFSINIEPLQHCRGIMTMLQHDAMLRAEDGDKAGRSNLARRYLSRRAPLARSRT